ncbi:MAG: helix-turn-helix transcriptional regulator [Acidimicrobiales bacterium]|jgi:DNA-binding NarL/FixJ family response regulator
MKGQRVVLWSEDGAGLTAERLEVFEQLTRRERQVLLALMSGSTAQEISKESYVSLPTVRSQIRSILSKLGVSSQLAAVVLAYRSGWAPQALPSGETPGASMEPLVVGL